MSSGPVSAGAPLDSRGVRSTLDEGDREVALVDLLDRLLAGGVVVSGDVTIAVAGVDLVHLQLRLLLSAIDTERGGP